MAKKGSVPWNVGTPMSEEQKQKLREKALLRKPTMTGKTHSEETKAKIKAARAKQVITSESVQKAIQTKKDNGYDLAPFRGKKHTSESKEKMRQASQKAALTKYSKSIEKSKELLARLNIDIVYSDINSTSIILHCNTCNNDFTFTRQYTMGKKLKPNLCPICWPRDIISSQAEKDIAGWLQSIGVNCLTNDRKLISPLELDIVIPDNNVAIEYCGLYWHSETNGKGSDYHLNKTTLCNAIGLRLITIFEDEWVHSSEIVKSRVMNLLGLTPQKLHARKCEVKEISSKEANAFLQVNHIQGVGRSNVRMGAYFDNKLVAVMTFSRSNISRKLSGWELDRFCTKTYTRSSGLASKMFKAFINIYLPSKITTYADRRWSQTGFYTNLGFQFIQNTPANYWYFQAPSLRRYHRFTLRKNATDVQYITEWENRQEQGWDRIWDCGSEKYVWEA